MVEKLEDENACLRTECGCILYFDTGDNGMLKMLFQAAQNWKQQREAGKVTISLRVALMLCLLKELQNSLEECAGGRGSEGRSAEARMDEGRGGCFGPFFGQSIMKWDPEKQKQVESAGHSVKDSKALDLIGRLRTTLPLETVLQRFHWTRPMAESYKSPVLPFLMTIGIRSAPAEQAHEALCDLIGCSALRMIGLRRMFLQPPSRTRDCATGRSARIAGRPARAE